MQKDILFALPRFEKKNLPKIYIIWEVTTKKEKSYENDKQMATFCKKRIDSQ